MSILELLCPHCGSVFKRGFDTSASLTGLVGERCDACNQPITLAHISTWMKQRAVDHARETLAERQRAARGG